MAEFYSANLGAEVRKGLSQKAKQGGWPTKAPIGYPKQEGANRREGGRQDRPRSQTGDARKGSLSPLIHGRALDRRSSGLARGQGIHFALFEERNSPAAKRDL